MTWPSMLFVVGAYLIGAIPFGLLIGLARGVDIRTRGSHNIGATNVGRVVGRPWGYLCLVTDILKGLGPTLAASLVLGNDPDQPGRQLIILLVALAAVMGHVFPVYLRFHGGKGVATTVGVSLGIWPYYTIAMLIALLAYAVARFSTGKVSIGSITLAIVFPLTFFVLMRAEGLAFRNHWPLQIVALLLGAMIIIRHADNIRRLIHGKEMGLAKQAPGGDGDSSELPSAER